MRRLTSVFLLWMLLSSISSAQQTPITGIPNLIRYSGSLKEAQESASSTAPIDIIFAIYKEQDGGAPIWMETQNVTPDTHGQYSVLLGSTTATGLPSDLFSEQEQRWLGIQVQGQAEQPRIMLVSVPYAFRAHEAETLGGLPASAFVKAPRSDGSVTAITEAGTAVNAAANASTRTTQLISAFGTPGYIPIWLGGTSFTNSTAYQTTAGNVGVGTTTPSAKLDVNGSINTATTYQVGGSSILRTTNSGTPNLFVGLLTGRLNSTGYGDTFVGTQAGGSNTGGVYNVFAGYFAGLNNTTGNDNVFIGVQAGRNNTTAAGNTFVGTDAGYSNITGFANHYFGFEAGYNNTAGNHNSFFGNQTGFSDQASDNTFYGYNAGFGNVTGSNNTYVGSNAGWPSGTGGGSYDTAIGSGAITGTGANITNATAIGANAVVNASNALVLGGTGASAVNVGIGTTTPTSALDMVGTLKLEGSGNGVIFPDGTEQTTAAGAGGVTSWNGRIGAVVPQTGDYNFTEIGQTLGSSQLAGTYNQAVTLSNTSNVLYGDGSHLTGIAVHTTAACVSEQGSPPGCNCHGIVEQCYGISNGGMCQVTSDTGSCSASAPNNSYGSCTVCRPN